MHALTMHALTDLDRIHASVGLRPGLTSEEVCRRLESSARSDEMHKRRLAFYLVEMDDYDLYQDAGFSSTAQYAERRLRFDDRRTRELLRLGRKLLVLPAIDAAFCQGKLGWSKLILLTRVAVPEHEATWLRLALTLDCEGLALQVKLSKEGKAPLSPGNRKEIREVRFRHGARVDSRTHALIERAKEKLTDELGEPVGERDFYRVAAEMILSSEADGTIPGRKRVNSSLYCVILRPTEHDGVLLVDTPEGPVPIADDGISCDARVEVVEDEYPAKDLPANDLPEDETPTVELAPKTPPKLREQIILRDGGRCRSCGSRHGLTVHHIQWRSKGGETRGANGITLCNGRCHSLVHADLLQVQGPDARHAVFADKDGRPLHEPGAFISTEVLDTLALPEVEAEADLVDRPSIERPSIVTLNDVPLTIDGAWWQKHADLVCLRAGKGLEFRPGTPCADDAVPGDAGGETLDPETAFAGLIGQDARIAHFRAQAKGSRALDEPFPHTLLLGPAGTGKTTLARGVAALVGGRLHTSTGRLLEDTHALVRLLAGLQEGDVLFLDEIHAVPRPVQEVLYQAMAERRLTLTLYTGSRSRSVEMVLPAFTLLAATTEVGRLPDALRSRFGLCEWLGLYSLDALSALLTARAEARGFTLGRMVAYVLSEYARGVPREALAILACGLRIAAGRGERSLDMQDVEETLTSLGFCDLGLKPKERDYLAVFEESDGPLPLHRICAELGTTPDVVLRELEPPLFRRGFIRMTPRGRALVEFPSLRLAVAGGTND